MNMQKYQDTYRTLWLAQNERDREKRPKLRTPNLASTAHYGKMGGAPKVLELSPKAVLVNNMLNQGMSTASIALIFGTSERSVTQMKSRYNLPRKSTA
tara:strand:+ start:176 stop:469 length:294 start_codon:yes stop_codon:yes gene_type:complete